MSKMLNVNWNKMEEYLELEQDRTVSGSSKELRKKQEARSVSRREAVQAAAKQKFLAAEKKAFESGAEKKGGFMGFGGSYSGKSEKDFLPQEAGASGGASNLSKGAAAASMAQEMGVLPQGGAVGGAVSGAATGAAFGPPGAIIGGVAGAVMGQAKARAAKKKEEAERERAKLMAISGIEMKKGQQIQSAYNQMSQNMLAALG